MAIFARLVCLLFAISFSAGLGGAAAAANFGNRRSETLNGAIAGAIVGIFIGRSLGNMVVGKPPKD